MKKYLSCVVLLFSLITLPAQNFVNEFGKVSRDDVDYSFYPQDKSAEAVVIYDIGKSYFARDDDDFDVIYERATRIKIFKESGKKWANIEIPFYRQGNIFEIVSEIEAYSCNYEDGALNKTKLDLSTCHDEVLNERWTYKKFVIPNVKPGSIIEYRYKVSSEYKFNFPNWYFQWKIPVIYSKYTTKMIPFYQYTWLLQGANKFDTNKSYVDPGLTQQFGPTNFSDMVYEYSMKDIPAFKDEEFISSDDDYLIKMNFQLSKVIDLYGMSTNVISTWPLMIKDRLQEESFGGYMDKSERMASKIFNLKTLSTKPPQEKLDTVINYIKANFSWNESNSTYASKTPKVFLKDKTGNNADINLFAVGLLKGCGINAQAVILSTRKNGKIKYDYPFNHFFNYVCVIADIDGKKVLTDATDRLLANNRIPEKCINDRGLLVQKDKVEWVSLLTLTPSKKNYMFFHNVSDSVQRTKVLSTSSEYYGTEIRKEYGDNTSKILKSLTAKGYTVDDSTIVVKDMADIKKPYRLEFKISDHPEKINGKIYVTPFINECPKTNPLKQQTRTYPLDMIYPTLRTYASEIEIPAGYKVEFIPENETIKNDQFELNYSSSVVENKINISLTYSFKLPVYPAEDYAKIKYYFNEIVNKGNQKVVLVKI